MNNEVPGASVPADILERMRKTTTRDEGIAEAWRSPTRRFSTCAARWPAVQLAAPLGRIDSALSILDTHAG